MLIDRRRRRAGVHPVALEVLMKRFVKVIVLLAGVAFAAACANQKAPAEIAIKSAETAWAAVSAEALRYLPDQAKGVEDAITAVKDQFAKGNYAEAIKGATEIPTKVGELEKMIADKKSEWTAAWRTLDSTLGSGITAVTGKVDELMAAKRLPAGVEKAAVEGAKTALAAAQQTYDEAKQAFQGGDYAGALAMANKVQAELGRIMTELKLEMPVAAEAGRSLVEAAKETIKDTMKK
jgi:hypothetical protein